MRSPEEGVHLLRVRRSRIDGKQQCFHACQVLGGFLEKHLIELAHVYGHAYLP